MGKKVGPRNGECLIGWWGEWLVGGVSRPIFCWFWTVSYRRGTIICLSHETLWVDVSVRSRIWMIWEYHEIISCSWDDSKLIRISTMIKEECMSQLGLNEKDLGIKEAGLPCLTVFSPWCLGPAEDLTSGFFWFAFLIVLGCAYQAAELKKNHLPRRHLKYTKKKAGRGLWGKMKALWQKNLFAYGGSDESFWSRPTAPNWLNTRHCGPPQAYILGVIERSGGIFGRKLKERDWGPKLAGRKTQLHMGHRVWLGYPTIFPLNSGCT